MPALDLAGAGIPFEVLLRFSAGISAQGFDLAPEAPVRVLLARDLLDEGLYRMCPESRATLLVEPGPDFWSVGPLLFPGELSCAACLQHWLLTARWRGAQRESGDLSGCEPAAIRMIAALVSQYLEGNPSPYVTDALLSVSSGARAVLHPIYPRRNCPECGQRPRPLPASGLRVHCSPLTGIIERMEIGASPAGGLYHAAATFFAPRPVSRNQVVLRPRQSYGRGQTPAEAELSCLAEALERYSIIYRGDELIVHARFEDLPNAIHPRDILLFSERQYANRDAWNPSHSDFQHVPVPLQPGDEIGWAEARRLTDGTPAWIPAAHCYMWYGFQPREPEIALADSNGCAAGPTVEEATLAALMELVERDAMAIWWYNRLRRPAIRAIDLADDSTQRVLACFAEMGRPIHVLDITTDLGIPAVVAIAPHEDGSEPFFASSAGWPREAAIRKAVSEVCQIWHSVTQRKECNDELARWLVAANTCAQPWLVPEGPLPEGLSLLPRETEPAPDVGARLHAAIARLQSAGLDPLVLDLSRDDVVLPVVRVVVPGLRHFWARFGDGRLYQVPLRLGWLCNATQEAALNPICCMI